MQADKLASCCDGGSHLAGLRTVKLMLRRRRRVARLEKQQEELSVRSCFKARVPERAKGGGGRTPPSM